jgi:L-alanine-DL-glutamate epimerase-like enolase superfamily enzyme
MLDQLRLHRLNFKKPAGTSRGVLHSKPSWIFTYTTTNGRQIETEFPIIPGLSPEFQDEAQYEAQLESFLSEALNSLALWVRPNFMASESWLAFIAEWQAYPSFIFGLEILVMGLQAKQYPILWETPFTKGQHSIPINGLVWMDTQVNMREQIQQKIAQGFKVVKLKIGAIAWEEELALIQEIRQHFSAQEITIRVDANGAFSAHRATEILAELKALNVHSIEQPIEAGQAQEMARLCRENIVPIALDEELIGVNTYQDRMALLTAIKPQYIILKPSLHGGFTGTKEWIEIAVSLGIEWWLTSALESSIGLNAIVQFGACYPLTLAQGFGTGALYTNNFDANLKIDQGQMYWLNDPHKV